MSSNLFSTASSSQTDLDTTLPRSIGTSSSSNLADPVQSMTATSSSSALAANSNVNQRVNASSTFDFVLVGEATNDSFTAGFGNTLFDGQGGLDVVDYFRMNQGITLGARGLVNKGQAGIDQLVSIESVIAPAGFSNWIDGSTANGTGASIDVNLSTNSLTINVSPSLTLNLEIQNFGNVVGSSEADVIIGNLVNNSLVGGAGSDILRGGGGFDRLTGGSGTDFFVLGDANRSDGLGDGFSTITDWDATADFLVTGGNPNAYSLDFANVLGGVGLDTIVSFGSDVVAVIEDNTDVSIARDFRFVTPGINQNVVGTVGNDRFVGEFGNRVVNGGAGLDIVDYSDLNQGISLEARGFINKGLAGIDQLIGVERVIASPDYANLIDGSTAGTGATINVDLSTNALTVNISPNFALNLTVQNFVDVIGTSQNDVIVGDAVNNTLIGGAGNDILRGGGGFDRLTGGTGTDFFVLGDANRVDGLGDSFSTITDWNAADDFIATGGNPNAYSLSFVNVSGGAALDTVIFFGNDAIAVVEDTTNVRLDRDFIFS
jgi:Ca2+-binding RTX toxin-like protein